MKMLDGKTAVVMGAGSGVGRASALRFTEEGASVVCADVNVDRATETLDQIAALGAPGKAVAVQCDVTREDDVAAALALCVAQFGRLDIVFNNVVVPTLSQAAQFEECTVEEFERLSSVNFRGVFLGCKHAVIQFKKQGGGGVILNTGSASGLVGWGNPVYGATKGAVHALTRAVAIECAPFGIRVNAICPGGMPFTNFLPAGGIVVTDENREMVGKHTGFHHPLGRPITAEDSAEAALYLVSDRAANVTGVLLPVDGGYVAR